MGEGIRNIRELTGAARNRRGGKLQLSGSPSCWRLGFASAMECQGAGAAGSELIMAGRLEDLK
jgi:hypothetical protein